MTIALYIVISTLFISSPAYTKNIHHFLTSPYHLYVRLSNATLRVHSHLIQ